jgi:hypothetical protein
MLRTCRRSTNVQASLTLPLVEEEAQKASYAAGGFQAEPVDLVLG